MIGEYFQLAMLLLMAHAVTDYAWQTEWMARLKNPVGINHCESYGPWWWTMAAHSLINGAGVKWAIGYIDLAIAECIIHFLADTLKCLGMISRDDDQWIHIGSKLLWAFIAVRRVYA